MDNLDPWVWEEQAQIARLKRKLFRDFSLYLFLLLLSDIKIGIALVACAFTWTWSVPRILPEYVQRCEEYLEWFWYYVRVLRDILEGAEVYGFRDGVVRVLYEEWHEERLDGWVWEENDF